MSTDTGQATWRLSQAQVLHCREKALCLRCACSLPIPHSQIAKFCCFCKHRASRCCEKRASERERGRGRQAERMRGGGERAAVFEWGKEHGCFHLVIYFAPSLSSPVSLYQTKYTFRCWIWGWIWCARFDCCGLRSFFSFLYGLRCISLFFIFTSCSRSIPHPLSLSIPLSLSRARSLNTCAHTH